MDIGDIPEEAIKEIEDWMNNYPRKLSNRKSSNEIYEKNKKYIFRIKYDKINKIF